MDETFNLLNRNLEEKSGRERERDRVRVKNIDKTGQKVFTQTIDPEAKILSVWPLRGFCEGLDRPHLIKKISLSWFGAL